MVRNISLVGLAVALIAIVLSAKRQWEGDHRDIASLAAEDALLSNALNQASPVAPPSTNEAWSELLKLRARVAELAREKRAIESRSRPAPVAAPATNAVPFV